MILPGNFIYYFYSCGKSYIGWSWRQIFPTGSNISWYGIKVNKLSPSLHAKRELNNQAIKQPKKMIHILTTPVLWPWDSSSRIEFYCSALGEATSRHKTHCPTCGNRDSNNKVPVHLSSHRTSKRGIVCPLSGERARDQTKHKPGASMWGLV